MTGNFNVDQNDLINVKTFLPPVSGDDIKFNGSLDVNDFHLKNLNEVSAVVNKLIQVKSNIDLNNTESLITNFQKVKTH